ncbi:IS256 family transposase [Mobilicoccus massiliensis]|uniref:IS256 family transposase n=1 Tax=Mobilicoccus massiliensis TaxID=1522310 RepID=UPI00058F3C48|nr:IS256 family transposase [Mobilicoccus massiliensis]
MTAANAAVIRQLVLQAKDAGIEITGPGGLLKQITKMVIESALDEEMSEHLGYDRHAAEGRNGGNSRNGKRSKTVVTDNVGEVRIDVPRDRDASFEPQLVKKRQRRLGDLDAMVLSLYAKGLTTGEISAHLAEVYGASVSKDTVSRITDRVIEEMQVWWARPLEKVYAAIFIDAIVVKVRDGQVRNRPFYAAIGVDLEGHKDVLGMWAGDGDGESAKYWLAVLTELRNRGVQDVFFVVCDGLKGLPDSVNAVFAQATVQTCIIHLIRNTFRYASRRYWDGIARDMKPIYTAPTAAAARDRFEEFAEKWGKPYPAIVRLWENAWTEFIPFLDYDVEIRRVICSTNAIESLNARYRRAVRARGHFPNEQAAMKTLYLVTRSLDPKGTGQTRWVTRWKPALNAFAITFADRIPAAEDR